MKKLSDHKGEEAITMWVDLLEPMAAIINDEQVKKAVTSGQNPVMIAKEILGSHKAEATEILLRIDDTELNGLNILIRLADILQELGESEDLKRFFGFAGQAMMGNESSGSATENTEGEGN